MSTRDFILICIGAYQSACDFIDALCDEYDIDLDEDDIKDIFTYHRDHIGNEIIRICYHKIISKYDDMGLDVDGFDYHLDDCYSDLTYNGEKVNAHDLDELVANLNN